MSKLLFITQKIDRNDDVLGVYHRWAEELGKKTNKLNVICLYKGENNLDGNIGVFSLGKENGVSRLKYIYRFYKYIFSIRKEYDTVLVHMNPIYIVLGGLLWKLWGKKVLLWYNHPMGNLMAKMGIFLSDKVFCTSPYSFSAKYKHTKIMPVGIDTSLFKLDSSIDKKSNRIVSLGRISPIKKIEILIEAVKILDSEGIDSELLIVGSPSSDLDKNYLTYLKGISSELISKNKIIFKPSVPNYEAYKLYNSANIFVNLTPTGSFDKSILEAMACELLVLVSNKTLANIFSDKIRNICLFKEGDSQELSKKIIALLSLNSEDIKEVKQYGRELVIKNHSLDKLMQDLANILNTV